MRWWSLVVLGGCVVSPLGGGGGGNAARKDAGTSTDAGEAGTTPPARDAGGLLGALCGKDAQSGTELCLAISACPDDVIDPDLYPECGYQIRGNTYLMLCLCQGFLCPIGVPQKCSDIAELLQSQSVLSVCAQINEGRCVRASKPQ
jgi:hypothetical protein